MIPDYAVLTVPSVSHPLYLSARPGFGLGSGTESIPEFTEHFRRAGVVTVAVLITAPEISAVFDGLLLRRYRESGFRVLHCPIEDFSVPADMVSFAECVDELWRALHHGPALMHCAAGLGRTGLTAACLLVRGGKGWREALEQVREVRPGAAQTPQQEEYVARFARYLRRRDAGGG
jgi:protein-tyrosine phosphatase